MLDSQPTVLPRRPSQLPLIVITTNSVQTTRSSWEDTRGHLFPHGCQLNKTTTETPCMEGLTHSVHSQWLMGTGTKVAKRCCLFKLGIRDWFGKHPQRAWHLFTQLLEEDEARMKAKHGRMQQKSRTQTSCSADERAMYATWQLGHGVHPQRHSGPLQLRWENTGPYKRFTIQLCHKEVLVPLVSILAQHRIFRGPSMSIIPKHVQHKGTAPEQVPTQPRKEH